MRLIEEGEGPIGDAAYAVASHWLMGWLTDLLPLGNGGSLGGAVHVRLLQRDGCECGKGSEDVSRRRLLLGASELRCALRLLCAHLRLLQPHRRVIARVAREQAADELIVLCIPRRWSALKGR